MTIQKSSQRKPKNGRLKHLRSKHIDNIQLLILALPAIVLLFVFCYIPMGGIILAFKTALGWDLKTLNFSLLLPMPGVWCAIP